MGCPICGEGALKPDGVFFGETIDKGMLRTAVKKSQVAKVVLMIGTSGTVEPAATLPILAKRKNKAKIVEVNIGPTRLSPIADIRLFGPSAKVLPKLRNLVETQVQGRQNSED